MPPTTISEELKQALLQWDDTDDESRAVSKARLEVRGADTFAQITALLQRRARLCLAANRIGVSSFVSIYPVMFGFLFTHERHAPMPPLIACALVGLFTIATISLLTAGWALSSPLSKRATQAIASQEEGQGLGVLAELTRANITNKTALMIASKRVQETSGGTGIALSDYQWDCLRRLITLLDIEATVALIHLFLHAHNASALPQVRRMAKQTRNWELQEAANDYFRRFAPDEVTTRHRLEVEPSRHADAAPVSVAPILACVMRLGSRDPAERQAAENTLRTMQPEQLTQILLLLDQEPPADKFISRAIVFVCSTGGALLGSLVYFWALRWPYFDAQMASTVAFAGAVASGAVGCAKGYNLNYGRRNRRRARLLGSTGGIFPEKRLLDVLAVLEDVALIGTILDHIPSSASLTGGTLRRTLRETLQNLLPRLRASDANLLSEQHRSLLNHELQRHRFNLSAINTSAKQAEEQAELDVAILKAWEQVGDERALTFVQQLADMTAASPAKKRVREAAEQCLPYLEARVGEQRQTQTLLRASIVPTEVGDILLRAATPHASPAEAEQLLRASIRNTED